MINKSKHLRIRLTEDQFQKLSEVLILEQKNKSEIVRDALNEHFERISLNSESRSEIKSLDFPVIQFPTNNNLKMNHTK